MKRKTSKTEDYYLKQKPLTQVEINGLENGAKIIDFDKLLEEKMASKEPRSK